MAPKQPCAKYQYVVTATGPKILPVEDPPCKDEESPADYNAGGYLAVKVGDSFKQGRYRVIRKLGWGHFSTVWLVRDGLHNCHSALKVVKSAGRYAETALDEIKLLTQVASVSPNHPGRSHVVSFLDSFSHQGPEASHVCIVFEPLGENLLALIERHKKKGVPRGLVKVIARQILLGLQYIHDECDLVHTDIKPENILISIPDVELHILDELSQSPSPTSRRVGVPLPNKTRAGVSIPPNQLRTRRQVQIFDSQPLSSPGRSAGLSGRPCAPGTSNNARPSGSASGTNSVNGSYITSMNMSRFQTVGSLPPANFVQGTAGSLSSNPIRKTSAVPSATHTPAQSSPLSARPPEATQAQVVIGPAKLLSSSTSSSSSSLSSTLASAAMGSHSIISTPPSSLSHSIGNVMTNFLAMSRGEDGCTTAHPRGMVKADITFLCHSTQGKAEVTPSESQSKTIASTSWKEPSLPSDPWVKVSNSVSSSVKSISSLNHFKTRQQPSNQARSQSGTKSSFWKDPGTSAPAPAVVVSAVVTADGTANGEFSDFLSQMTHPESSLHITATKRPDGYVSSNSLSKEPNSSKDNSNNYIMPSLLTRTAPICAGSLLKKPPIKSPSPLSAQPITQDCSPGDTPHPPKKHTSKMNASRSLTSSTNDIPFASSPATVILLPPAPPSTPIVPPTLPILIPTPTESYDYNQLRQHNESFEIPPVSIKIADLGNATPSKKHFTEDIQTRQYRAPEAILGKRDWDAKADVWSVACVIFELLTAEYLFDPQGQGEMYTKDDDHMAQIIELLGDFPLEVKMGGKFSRELFDHTGALRYIKTLKFWPLLRVMTEKYLFPGSDAQLLCEFLLPMLAVDTGVRAHARDMVNHKWLKPTQDEIEATL